MNSGVDGPEGELVWIREEVQVAKFEVGVVSSGRVRIVMRRGRSIYSSVVI